MTEAELQAIERRRAEIRERVSRPGRVLGRHDMPDDMRVRPGEESLWDGFRRIVEAHGGIEEGELEIPPRLPPRDPPTFD